MSETKHVLSTDDEGGTTTSVAQAVVQQHRSRMGNIRWDILWERYGIAAILLVIWLLSFLLIPDFSNIDNFTEILRQSSFVEIAAVGMMIVILLGSFDLSVGSTLALCAWLTVTIAGQHQLLWAFVATLLLGCFIGAINGALIAFLRIPAFIVTLSMLFIISGYTYVITGGNSALYTGLEFTQIGGGDLLGVPIPFVVFVICALLGKRSYAILPLGAMCMRLAPMLWRRGSRAFLYVARNFILSYSWAFLRRVRQYCWHHAFIQRDRA